MRVPQSRLRRGALALSAVSAVLLTGCAASDGEASSSSGPTIAGGTSGDEWALEFTGGTAGAADPAKAPIEIGYVNGDTLFPDTTPAVLGAVEYINENLGGIGGHPLQLQTCSVNTDDEGRACATQMLNSDVSMVVEGTMSFGGATFFSTLNGQKPTLVGMAITPEARATPNTYNYLDSSVTLTAAVSFASTLVPAGSKAVAVALDAPSGRDSLDNYVSPGLREGGIEVTTVPVPNGATGPQIATALQAAGAADADMILNAASPATCAAIYDALQQIPNQAKLVDLGACLSTALTQHLKDLGVQGDFPDGWYFAGGPYTPLIPTDDGGVNTYLQVMKDKAPQIANFYSTFTAYSFAALMDTVAMLNPIADDLTPEAITQAITTFDRAPMLATDKPDCGWAGPRYPGTCEKAGGVYQYTDGEMTSVQSGHTDDEIVVDAMPGQ